MKNNINETMSKYTAGEITVEEANAALEGAGFHLDPQKNVLTEEEKRATTIGCYPDQANGFGLLDTGTGTLDKVHVVNGRLDYPVNEVNADGTANMFALCIICGRTYEVKGAELVDVA